MSDYNVLVSYLVLILLVHKSVLSEPLKNPPDGYIGTHSMNYLRNVEGNTTSLSMSRCEYKWYEAKQACLDTGMQMASITSENQAKFLNGIPRAENYTGKHFWTAGRDSQTVSQFLWDTDNITVTNPGVDFIIYYPPQSCLLYMSQIEIGQFFSSLCWDAWGTLCELNIGD